MKKSLKPLLCGLVLVMSVSLIMVFSSSGCRRAAPPVEESVIEEPVVEEVTTAPETTVEVTAIPETTAEAAGADTTTDTTISAEELTRAKEAFASGAVVYLYDPQPATVSKSDLDATEFSLRYILSKDAKAVTTLVYILKVDAEGVNEPVFGDGNMDDWISETGKITFKIMSNPLQDVYDQVFKDEGITIQHVNDPVYLDILLLSPEEQDESLLVSDSSKQLSNIVRIPVSQ